MRIDRSLRRPQRLLAECRRQRVGAGDRRLRGAAHQDIAHHALLVVHDEQHPERRRQHARRHVRLAMDARIAFRRQVVRPMILAGQQAVRARRRIGRRQEADFVDQCLAPANVPVRGSLRGNILRELAYAHPGIGLVLHQPERPGAGEILERIGCRGNALRHDLRRTIGKRQQVEQRRVRLLQHDLDSGGILRRDRVQEGPGSSSARRQPSPPLQRGHHIVRGHRAAIVKRHTAAQLDDVAFPAIADLGQFGREQRCDAIVGPEDVQRLVEKLGDLRQQIRCDRRRIERSWISRRRDIQHAGGLRPGAPVRHQKAGRTPEHERAALH